MLDACTQPLLLTHTETLQHLDSLPLLPRNVGHILSTPRNLANAGQGICVALVLFLKHQAEKSRAIDDPALLF